MAYSVLRFNQAYEVGWPNITDRNQWPEDQKGFKVYTPEANKRGVGRHKKNRIPSYLETIGKATRHIKCDGCGEKGHRKENWRCGLTRTKKEEDCNKI